VIFSGCRSHRVSNQSRLSRFAGLTNFSSCTRSQNSNGETVLLSPEITSPVRDEESGNPGPPAPLRPGLVFFAIAS
jgi:hypothetical protein